MTTQFLASEVVVVSGHGLIQLRKIGTEEVVSFEVSGGGMEVVEMIPGLPTSHSLRAM